jgi:hypothetical protein
MSRIRPDSGPSISLFPFLAVLLCTMGSLLVLLVLFSRAAQQPAGDEVAAKAAAAHADELAVAQDELAWRLQQLQSIRDRTADDLARARLQLAGVEEDARRITDELDALERTAEALAAGTQPDAADAEAVAKLEQTLADARAALDAERDDTAKKPAAFAVVPYVGANGTHRRPLYIECCIDGVFLQPEGIRLGPADFEGPPGPGNPLASALRAAREHIASAPGETGAPQMQPYPLLLVRPSGVMAYYAAREAIQSWGSEFGYQFIDEEWQLAYPPADPALAEAERRAVEESRRRLAWLQQVRPARPAKPVTQYRAATTRGGVVANGGPSVLGDQSRFDWTEEQASSGSRGGGQGGGGFGGSGGAGDGTGGGGSAQPGRGFVAGGSGEGSVGLGTGQPGSGGAFGGSPAGATPPLGDRYSGPSKFYAAAPADSAGGSAGAGGPAGGDGTQDTAEGTGGATGTVKTNDRAMANAGTGTGPGGGQADGASASGSGAENGQGGVGGHAGLASAGRSGAGGGGGEGSAASGATGGGGSGPSMPGLPQGSGGASASAGSSAGASLAGRRGSNWASLATHDRPIPITRPIRVECSANEFRILADGSNRVETRIPVGTHTLDSVDLLVQAVHARVNGWGIAGDRMYWRPELVLSETPDGRGRREDLERLLADSGLDTRRKGEQNLVRPLPPVRQAAAVMPVQ